MGIIAYLGVIMNTIPCCTIITDQNNPFSSGSGMGRPRKWKLYERVESLRIREIGSEEEYM